ncbi:amidase, partial [Bacteroidota bacterium]
LNGLKGNKKNYEIIHNYLLANSVPPSIGFNPVPLGFNFEQVQQNILWDFPKEVTLPDNLEELAFYSVSELSVLIKNKKISSEELTRFYINRLKKYDKQLHCVITLTEKLAIKQARKADYEIAKGIYRGPLHGIPYGVKDLLAVEGYKTTWGSAAHKDQIIEETATVVKKLEEAGAVLVAKLSLGSLAMGDIWYGEKTRNPWNPEQGSSGSSAGPASATAAGLVGFSIGSETLGSIVSPSTRCGVTGLRPSYGRVSRTGAMALSWTMDKLGPICRTAEDCALVFEIIRGSDNIDQTLYDAPFNYNAFKNIKNIKVGYTKDLFEKKYRGKSNDSTALEVLKNMGIELIPVKLPDNIPVNAIGFILSAEASAAFDELTRSDRDELLVSQRRYSWPNSFRQSRFIPAVEYINANRIRFQLIQEMYKTMKDIDVLITPSFGGNQLSITNLTGQPCIVIPNGFNNNGTPTSFSIIGKLFDEANILRIAKAYQDKTKFTKIQPELFKE